MFMNGFLGEIKISHTTTLKTVVINDIDALEETVQYLNNIGTKCSLLKNQRPRMYYENQHGVCDYILRIDDCSYDVGFAKQEDGSYLPVFDSYANILRRKIGAPMKIAPESIEDYQVLAVSKLLDLYGVHAAKNQLEQDGYGYSSTVSYNVEDDSYVLEVSESY